MYGASSKLSSQWGECGLGLFEGSVKSVWSKKMNSLGQVLSLLMSAWSWLAVTHGDRVEIDTGDFVKDGIGYNGDLPGR